MTRHLLLTIAIGWLNALNIAVCQQALVGKPGDCYVNDQVVGYVIGATCPDHFYCPNTTTNSAATRPQICPASFQCQLQRLAGLPCEAQGEFEPVVCPYGHYCATPQDKEVCPQGSFCPTGSVAPVECPPLSICPEGVRNRRFYGGLVICLVLDAALLCAHGYISRHRRQLLAAKLGNSKRHRQSDAVVSPRKAVVTKSDHLNDSIVIELGGAVASPSLTTDNKNAPPSEPLSSDNSDKWLLYAYRRAFASFDTATWGVNNGSSSVMPRLDFQFENLGCTLPGGQTLLSGVNGAIQSGRVTAIMGPSGAGKTTFMSVLMGKMPCSHGQLFVNRKSFKIESLRSIVGYVPQDDIMLHEMTVREIITHSAQVRLPREWTEQERHQYIDAVLMNLGLWHVEHSYIGDESTRGISGGQRKRVNIGVELAAAPLAIFADEPTSGLDSTAALQVANTLQGLAALGVTVVAVLHQPRFEIFEQFDDLLLIAPGGRTAYLGPRADVVPYFQSLGFVFDGQQNPADVLMDILSGKARNDSANSDDIKDLAALWSLRSRASLFGSPEAKFAAADGAIPEANSLPNQTYESVVESHSLDAKAVGTLRKKSIASPSTALLMQMSSMRNGATVWRQLWLCHRRSVVQQYRHSQSFGLEVGVAALAGGLMGLSVMGISGEMFRGFYVQPLTGISPAPIAWIIPLFGMLNAMAVGIAGAPAGVKTFGEEKTLFAREYSSGHSAVAYFISKTVAAVYRFVLTSLHFTAIVYFLGTPIISFGSMFVIILMLFYCVFGLASVVSMFTRRENASLLAVVVCLFAATLCGFGPTLKDARSWGLMFLWDLSYAKWGAEALYTEEVGFFRGVYDVDASAAVYGYTLDRFQLDIVMMLVIGTVLRFVSFAAMMYGRRMQRN